MNSRGLHHKDNLVNGEKHGTVGNRATKLFLRRSSLHLKRDLDEIDKKQHRALSKIDRDLDETRFALKALWIEKHKAKTNGTLLRAWRKSSIQRNHKELFTPPVLGSTTLQRNSLRNEVRRGSGFQLVPDQPLREARNTPSEDGASSLRNCERGEVGDGATVDSSATQQQQLIPSQEKHPIQESESIFEKHDESEGGIVRLTDNEDGTADTVSPRDCADLQTGINDILPFGDSVEDEDDIPDGIVYTEHSKTPGGASTSEAKVDGIPADLEELRTKPRKLFVRRKSSPNTFYPRTVRLGSVREEGSGMNSSEAKDDEQSTDNDDGDMAPRVSRDLEELTKPKTKSLLSRRASTPNMVYPQPAILGSVRGQDSQASLPETKDGKTTILKSKDGDLASTVSRVLEEQRKHKPKRILGRRKSSPSALYPRTAILESVGEEYTAGSDQVRENRVTRRRRSVAVMTTADPLAFKVAVPGGENMAACEPGSGMSVGTRRRSVAVMTTADRLPLTAGALIRIQNMAACDRGSEMKVTRRRSSVVVMTTADRPGLKGILQASDKTFSAFPKQPSVPLPNRPRPSLSQQGQTKDKLSGGPTEAVHDSLLKIGRRMVAPLTGAQLENRLRRYSVQYPLQTGLNLAIDESRNSNEASDNDPFRGLENCRYLRRVSK